MSLRISASLALILTLTLLILTSANPVERIRGNNGNGPMVVDIPAGMFDGDSLSSEPLPKLTKVPLEVQQSEVEFAPPKKTVLSGDDSLEDEDDGMTPNKGSDSDTDIFGVRVPTIFVIRRPIFRDPFASFTPFQNFNPFAGFGQRRPVVTEPSLDDTEADKEEGYDVLNHMETMLKRMQQQMSSLWGSVLTPNVQRRPFRPVFPSFESAETDNNNTETINIDKLPDNYSNSTSETKVVDGHVVQVNKTIHKTSSGNNSGFFSFQVINVRPTQEPSTSSTPAEPETPESGEGQPIVPVSVDTEVKPEGTHNIEITQEGSTSTSTTTPKPEDPTLNEVGGGEKEVSGIDTGLIVDEPKVQAS
jgi:hypothetical protein